MENIKIDISKLLDNSNYKIIHEISETRRDINGSLLEIKETNNEILSSTQILISKLEFLLKNIRRIFICIFIFIFISILFCFIICKIVSKI